MEEFDLEGQEFIELCDLLKIMGVCETGGHAKMEIAAGQVMVDGKVETRKRCKIRAGQLVEYAGNEIKVAANS